jgi:hypothetical protein
MAPIEPDMVVFGKFPDGGIIALFPYLPAECLNSWLCESYMHIRQHGAADPLIVYDTRPANPEEFASLKSELERIGYQLAVRRRFPSDAHARRATAMTALCAAASVRSGDSP